MRLLNLVPVFALTLGLSFSANAGTPKGEAKDVKAEAPAPKSTSTDETLYYFPISGDGNSFSSRTSTTSNTSSSCDGEGLYCEVGLDESQVDINELTGVVTVKSSIANPPATNRTREEE